jgi:hypothetical protein
MSVRREAANRGTNRRGGVGGWRRRRHGRDDAGDAHEPARILLLRVGTAAAAAAAAVGTAAGEVLPLPVFPYRRLRVAAAAAAVGTAAGEVLPLPVFPYRRLRVQGGQGRGGLGYRFTV